MPQRDVHHHAVRNALLKDGWTITHDLLTIPFGVHNVFVDLGAERILAAERGQERIAVEIKSFVGPSEVADVEQALGRAIREDYMLALLVFDPHQEIVRQWLK